MRWRTFRRVWVTLSNVVYLGLIGISFMQDYELSSFHGATRPANIGLGRLAALVFAILLLSGIVLEWLDSVRPAFIVNVGFFAFFGLGVLSEALLAELAKLPGHHDPEGGLAIAIVGIPCTIVALTDFLLYWTVHPSIRRSSEAIKT